MENEELRELLGELLNKDKPLKELLNGCDEAKNEEFNILLHQLDELAGKSCIPDKRRIWSHIYQQLIEKRRRIQFRRWSVVAAVLLPAIVAVSLFLIFTSCPESLQNRPLATVIDRNQVRLLLDDGRVIHVQQLKKASLLQELGVGIQIDTASTIRYQSSRQPEAELVYHVLNVPRCCEYHMILSDGSEVWLNSDSELRFPVDFVEDERRVYLKGEAYFKVAKNTEKPFRVNAGDMVVEALGTGFDVNAYRENGRVQATLVEGKVKISAPATSQECILTPGTQAYLQKGKLNTRKVDVNDVIGWEEGRFVFSNMTLEEIAWQLERWY
ncbi:MAG: FecR domain-containing protein, partial [Odoribacter sp.]